MKGARIVATGSYQPNNHVSNKTMETLVETSDEWIQTRSGIKTRAITIDENTSDIAYEAAIRAMNKAGIVADKIDMIIVGTVTGDYVFPGVSQLLQKRLGAREIPAFDVNAACSGFIYTLEIAHKMIKSDAYDTVLIIGAEALSKYTDFSDRNTCVLFADGAGAAIVQSTEREQIFASAIHSRGSADSLKMDGYPLKENFKTPHQPRPFIQMQGKDVFKFATTALPETIETLLAQSNLTIESIDKIIAHQANARIITHAAKHLNIPMDKMVMNIEHTGNTSSASVPLALDEAIQSDQVSKGDTVLMVAFGGGLTWGGAIVEL